MIIFEKIGFLSVIETKNRETDSFSELWRQKIAKFKYLAKKKFIELKYLAISFTMDHKYFLCLWFTFMTHIHLLRLVRLAPSSGL